MTELSVTPAERRLTLAALAVVVLLSALDQTVVSTAMPRIIEQLQGLSMYAWVTTAYMLTSTVSVPIYGKLSDQYGRKGILQLGLAVFGAASLAAVFVNDPGWLIGLRAVVGLGAALVMPTTLSIITNVFPEDERGRAVGIWAGIAGAGAVVGLLLSGTLLEWFS